MPGKLCLVGTPIGNLGDMSPRALRALEEADFIAAEDTRVTLKLLNHFNIKKPLVSYYEHNARSAGERILERILAGESCALVTNESYNVLCYKRVLRACLLLKARDFPLADGSLTFAIDGYDARECLRITVEGGRPRVEAVGEEAGESALPLSHAQAMELFFAPWSRLRQTLPAFAAGWFPLSLYVPAVDND